MTADELPLRLRKKIRTRQQIADAAAQLFAARGYDAVTVADVARLAEVSEQTVYNFFSSKEQLVLDEDAVFEAQLLAMVRSPGTALEESVRAGAHRFLDELERRPAGAHRAGSMPCLIQVSPTLRRAWLEALDRYAGSLAGVLAERSAGALSLPVARVLAAAILAVFAMIIDEVGRAMESGRSVRPAIRKLRGQVDEALEHLAPVLRSLQR
jgi:AcrR family transcriptional regulator